MQGITAQSIRSFNENSRDKPKSSPVSWSVLRRDTNIANVGGSPASGDDSYLTKNYVKRARVRAIVSQAQKKKCTNCTLFLENT